jgi:putative FmdB family regulatory protein
MPIYEYRCEACHQRFEAFLATSSEQAVCPQCHGTKLHKLMSTFAASVPGGYKSAQMGTTGSTGPSTEPPKSGGHGHGPGCGCH